MSILTELHHRFVTLDSVVCFLYVSGNGTWVQILHLKGLNYCKEIANSNLWQAMPGLSMAKLSGWEGWDGIVPSLSITVILANHWLLRVCKSGRVALSSECSPLFYDAAWAGLTCPQGYMY